MLRSITLHTMSLLHFVSQTHLRRVYKKIAQMLSRKTNANEVRETLELLDSYSADVIFNNNEGFNLE